MDKKQNTGHWITMYESKNMVACSKCNKCTYLYNGRTSAYCPHCGDYKGQAQADGEATDDDIATMRILFNADIECLCNQGRFNDAKEMEQIRDRLMASLQADGDIITALCSLPKIISEDGQDYVQLYDVLETVRRYLGDCISKTEAIKTIQQHGVGCFDADDFTPEQCERYVIKLLQDLKPSVAIPSAEPKWIPVSERLPEKNGRYLCTVGTDYRNPREMYYEPKGKNNRTWASLDSAYVEDCFVIAWMPLPKPYELQENKKVDCSTCANANNVVVCPYTIKDIAAEEGCKFWHEPESEDKE